jgi:hypothetical protein
MDRPPLTIQIKVKSNARVSLLEELPGDAGWSAKLKSPPVDGRANEELISLVADKFGCRKALVTIRAGASGRLKLVRIGD